MTGEITLEKPPSFPNFQVVDLAGRELLPRSRCRGVWPCNGHVSSEMAEAYLRGGHVPLQARPLDVRLPFFASDLLEWSVFLKGFSAVDRVQKALRGTGHGYIRDIS